MSEMNRMAYFSTMHADKIKRLCMPLERAFGVEYFWCSKTDDNGNFFCLGNNEKLHEFYYASKSYLANPFYRAPKLIYPGYYFHRDYGDRNYLPIINNYIEKFNIEFCAVILMKMENTLLRFGYASKANHSSRFRYNLLNNMNLIKRFNHYFLSESANLFARGENYSVNLKEVLGSTYQQPLNLANAFTQEDKLIFLNQLGLLRRERVKKLSRQERKCLKFLAQGHNTPQIAHALNISPRTAEHYIESTKNKLCCDTKYELFKCANLLLSSEIL